MKALQWYLIGLLWIGVSIAGYAQSRIPRDAQDATELFFNLLQEADSPGLGQLLAPDFEMVDFQGKLMNKETILQWVEQGNLQINASFVNRIRTKTYSEIELVNGNWNVSLKWEGIRWHGDVYFVAIYQKVAGLRKLISLQITPLK
jgi:ketosteroid isomerase-like protein